MISNKEASQLQDGATKYAQETFLELEARLAKIRETINAGKKELNRLNSNLSSSNLSNNSSDKTIPFRRKRTQELNYQSNIKDIG